MSDFIENTGMHLGHPVMAKAVVTALLTESTVWLRSYVIEENLLLNALLDKPPYLSTAYCFSNGNLIAVMKPKIPKPGNLDLRPYHYNREDGKITYLTKFKK